MTKTREKSDRCVVPEKDGNASGGKAAAVSKQVSQLGLRFDGVDSPQGDIRQVDTDESVSVCLKLPQSKSKANMNPPAITMEEIASRENLKRAIKQVISNKGSAGPDGMEVSELKVRKGEIISLLHTKLLEGTYRPGLVKRVWIPKANGQRGLGVPDVVDRVVQQAVLQVMSPHYEPEFHPSSHGFRKGRSCQTAIAEATSHIEEGYDWVVDIDLEKFFDGVNHQRLISRLEKKITDKRVIRLIVKLLKSKVVMPDGLVVTNDEGAPQGGPLSPLLSNIVLDELDWELEKRGHRFVRYADDQNIYVRSERAGKRVMEKVSEFIVKRLRLKVNRDKSAVAKTEERHFVGFSLRRDPESGSVEVKLSKRSEKRIRAKSKELTPRNWGKSLKRCIAGINEYFIGWMGFFRIVTEQELRTLNAIDAHTRRRLRAIILKHWKRKRTIAKALISKGAGKKSTWKAIYKDQRSWWQLSHIPIVDRILNNKFFRDSGLVSLADKWREFQTKSIVNVPAQLPLRLG